MANATPQPFTVGKELCNSLKIEGEQIVPFSPLHPNSLPGQPSVPLNSNKVLSWVHDEFSTPILDQISRHIWLLASPNHRHISPLHQQIVRGRQIIVCEDPEMHLVWIHDRVFIKPLPEYLLSHAFWSHYLKQSTNLAENENVMKRYCEALGYLRTWAFLVKHESDYRIAVKSYLIPEKFDFSRLIGLLSELQSIGNNRVSSRYQYGELRLSRLNFWVRFWLHKPYFHKIAWQYSDYFSMYYAPLLFLFGVLSVTLSAMSLGTDVEEAWTGLRVTAARFSVATLCLVSVIILYILMDFFIMSGREIAYAFRHHFGRKKKLVEKAGVV